MKLPLSWLKEFVQIEAGADEISHRLSVAGLEVENIERTHPAFAGVTVGRVLSVDRHPNADRLSLCEVDAGQFGHFRVVCGAPNVRPGMMAPFARVGARLGGARKGAAAAESLEEVAPLQAAEIRGVRSEGMLCSGRELGLSEDHSGILELEADAPLGGDLAGYLELDETVFDIAITPNRGDCLSILGLSREVAALFELKLKLPKIKLPKATGNECPDIEIHAADLCRRYAGLPMGGIKIGTSPGSIRRRLELCGMRALNNVVDVTNYVMLELGQPLHAFDLDKIQGGGKIVVRRAGDDREFVTLDAARRQLHPDDLLIADAVRPLAIAGVMGGLDSEVSDATSRILLESAYFEPMTVARTARRLGLRSESSYRFERGIDRAGQVVAISRAAELIRKFAGGRELASVRDLEPEAAPRREIDFDLRRAADLLGIEVPAAEVRRRLISIGAAVHSTGRNRFSVIAPSFRPDLNEPADLAEEIGRLRGFEEIADRLPERPAHIISRDPARAFTARTREVMLGCGLTEIRTIAFIAPEDNRRFPGLTGGLPVVVTNPLSAELSQLRTSLLPGLLAALRFNLNRQSVAMHAFEIAKTFDQRNGLPGEAQRLAGVSYGDFLLPAIGSRPVQAGFFTVKGILETYFRGLGIFDQVTFVMIDSSPLPYLHPGAAAEIKLSGSSIGVAGELHPQEASYLELSRSCGLFELDFGALADYRRPPRHIEPPPRFPAVRRDLALVLDRDVPGAAVIETIGQHGPALLESVEIFDVYTGEGIAADKKSVALSLRYRDKERTLTDEEVNRAHEELVKMVLPPLNAQMRQ
ncbi:MAG TPA: phenylalanine--tRNA ligase subunit beta [Candidatus Binataceae bacterium]|nr:phenylalanine--tRNA ligase subunit beta [Candidatus Binataceae bacterium]